MKKIDRAITLSTVVAFFIGIFVLAIKWLNIINYITITSNTHNFMLLLLVISLGYLAIIMIVDITRIIEIGKSNLDEEEKKKERENLVKMFFSALIGIMLIFMLYYMLYIA